MANITLALSAEGYLVLFPDPHLLPRERPSGMIMRSEC